MRFEYSGMWLRACFKLSPAWKRSKSFSYRMPRWSCRINCWTIDHWRGFDSKLLNVHSVYYTHTEIQQALGHRQRSECVKATIFASVFAFWPWMACDFSIILLIPLVSLNELSPNFQSWTLYARFCRDISHSKSDLRISSECLQSCNRTLDPKISLN